MGHRRFLPPDHKWQSQKAQFDGKRERKGAPKRLSGDDVLNQLGTLTPVTLGKAVKRKRLPGRGKCHNWKNRSIFFDLPYWRTLLLRHNLDVMHIKKNICDSVMGTILDIDKKSKDSLNARLDLKMMGIRKELHSEDGKTTFPRACYTLLKDEKKAVFQWLQNVNVPDGYSANLSQCVNVGEQKIFGMKTHYCHVFLERLLPLVVRELLPK